MPVVTAVAEPSPAVEIPRRALFKAAEVCEILRVQPYVLRSWEAEFPELGVAKTAGGPRVYRRTDVERAARLKHLLLVEGLTLAGARRKLDGETAPVAADAAAMDELLGQNARERLADVKRGLQAILDLLAGSNGGGASRVAAPMAPGSRTRPTQVSRAKASRGKPASRGQRGSSRKRT